MNNLYQLLKSQKDEIKYVPLNIVLEKYFIGTHGLRKYYTNKGVKCLDITNFNKLDQIKNFISFEDFEKFPTKAIKRDDVLLSVMGTIGKVMIFEKDDPLISIHSIAILRPNKNIIHPRYLYFALNSSYLKSQIDYYSYEEAIIPRINLSKLPKINIPLPPLHTQNHIVSILDKLSNYTNNLDMGLLKERELRKKQYEYYLGKLVNKRSSSFWFFYLQKFL